MWNICRHWFAQNASYLLLTFKHYGRLDKRVPVFDYSKVEDSDPDICHGLVCDFRILFFFMPTLSLWIHLQIPKLIGQVSEGRSTNMFKTRLRTV